MKSKKAQGLPMNTIVIAAIVLIVLVVLIMIFTGSSGQWLKDLIKTEEEGKKSVEAIFTCGGKGGEWMYPDYDKTTSGCPEGRNIITATSDSPSDTVKICCEKI